MRLWIFLFLLVPFSYWLTDFYRRWALSNSIIDTPNERSSHSIPTPRGGGIALILCYYLGLLAIFIKEVVDYPIFLSLVFGGLIVAIVGWVDDRGHVAPLKRLFVHISAAAFAMIMIADVPKLPVGSYTISLEHTGYILCVLAIVWSTNLFNFMDGIDGLAAIEVVTVSIGAAIILYLSDSGFFASVSLVLLAFSTLGFLLLNFPPAKIFMGDVGSGFLGCILGIYAIGTSVGGDISPWSWMILYGVFLVDATVTLVRRIVSGQKWYEAHRSHAYQILSRRWNNHKKVTLLVLAINVVLLFPAALAATYWPQHGALLCLGVFTPLIWGALALGAGNNNE